MPPVAVAPPPLSVGSFVRFGWETFKKRPWFFVGAVLVFLIASWAGSLLNSFVAGFTDAAAGSVFGVLLGFAIGMAFNTLLGLGWLAFFLKAHDDVAAVTISSLWHPQKFWSFLGTNILYGFIVLFGYVLFIVPGIIATVTFMFATYFVVDKGLGPIEALKASARITKGNRLRLLAFVGAGMLISLLGMLALVVGLFVAVPVVSLAGVQAYRRLSAAADATAARVPLTGGEIALLIVGLILPLLFVLGILSSVVLASLNAAREKGQAARVEADLKMLQLGIELYRDAYGAYPATLSDVVQDPSIWTDSSFLTDGFTYTPLGDSYRLCSNEPVLSGDPCVTSMDLAVQEEAQ